MAESQPDIERHIAAVTMAGGDFRREDPFLLEDLLSEEEKLIHALVPGRAQTGISAF
jgi:hypothetical protein